MRNVKPVSPSKISHRTEDAPRGKIDPAHVGGLVELIEAGTVIDPPIVYDDGSNLWLAEGFHRIAAYQTLNCDKILCDVRKGSRREARLHAAAANAAHGLPRSYADKRKSVMMCLEDPEAANWSAAQIARHCSVSGPFVSAIKEAMQLHPMTSEELFRRSARKPKISLEDTGEDLESDLPPEVFNGDDEVEIDETEVDVTPSVQVEMNGEPVTPHAAVTPQSSIMRFSDDDEASPLPVQQRTRAPRNAKLKLSRDDERVFRERLRRAWRKAVRFCRVLSLDPVASLKTHIADERMMSLRTGKLT